MNNRTLMIQGTTSDAGKSTLVAGLCRLLKNRGWQVAPMKPQNMALNSAVTSTGGEIGRAQAVQAQACGLPPDTDMNPVLLKPSSDTGAQIIINGKALSNMEAQDYHAYKSTAMKAVLDAHRRLEAKYDAIIVEGAGSPAEINLRDNDIANMGFAEAVDCPVLIVADIDKGGVFAHLVGTLELLSPSEQERVAGFIINRFRGDISLLQPGLEWLEQRTGKPVLGVLPYIENLYLESEDAINLHQANNNKSFSVVIPVLPRISNHTDFDSLQQHPDIELEFIRDPQQFRGTDLLVIPGSKNVCQDRHWLRESGWEDHIYRHLRYGGKLLGICGGFQMLGRHIHDPEQIEGTHGCEALGLLDFETRLEADKTLVNREGRLALDQSPVHGYEIHVGRSEGPALASPLVHSKNFSDGVISGDGQIAGTYLHGLFDQPQACNAILKWAGLNSENAPDMHALRESELDRLSEYMQENIDMDKIEAILKKGDSND